MTDFLLELRSEEIPARMQAKAREDLARLFAAEIARAGLAVDAIVTYATPRRLALIARDLPAETAAVSAELKGPKTSAPSQALDGFLCKTGLTRDQLVERDGILYAVTDKPGRATAEVLAEAIPAIVRAFPWPKSMRWGAASTSTESPRWVRPLQGIVALFGEEVVPVTVAGIESGAATLGHRFHHPGVITIGGAHDYVEKLRACHVIVDQDERAALIRERAAALAAEAGLALVEDEGLVAENAGLTEWPVPLLGRFDAAFLDVPPEVIQLTARVNQKYFVCRDGDGRLASAFVCTANIEATDGGATIVEGNRKVLAARLADARFFYETDRKVSLAEQARKLNRIVFHEKLGMVADKVERIAKLTEWLAAEGIVPGCDPSLARRAAELCKADLVTGMVGEFPELQGLMGGYYAAAQGEAAEVAEAIRDHYKPVGQGDEVPTAPVTVAVSLADKLDTITSFWVATIEPTGSKDPFALRRSVISVIELILSNLIRVPLDRLIEVAMLPTSIAIADAELKENIDQLWEVLNSAGQAYIDALAGERELSQGEIEGVHQAALFSEVNRRAEKKRATASARLIPFFADRLKVQQREAGVRHDLIDAVFALGGEDDLVRLLARVRALQAFVGTEDGTNLLAGYKRAANILKKEGYTPLPAGEGQGASAPRGEGDADAGRPHPSGPAGLPPSPEGRGNSLSYTPETAESALIAALDVAAPAAAEAVAREEFEGAMAALATLRAPIDAFFDTVTVNDPDQDKRASRLALLARVRDAVHEVADFSKIEG